jgi:hypothetical protein
VSETIGQKLIDGFEVTDPMHGGKIGVSFEKNTHYLVAKITDDTELKVTDTDNYFWRQGEDLILLNGEEGRKLYLTLGTIFELTDAP